MSKIECVSNCYHTSDEVFRKFLYKVGFRSLNESTLEDLPEKSLVVLYGKINGEFNTGIAFEHNPGKRIYLIYRDNFSNRNGVTIEKRYFGDWLYKVLATNYLASPSDLSSDAIQAVLTQAGFRKLSSTTSEDIPKGALVVFHSTRTYDAYTYISCGFSKDTFGFGITCSTCSSVITWEQYRTQQSDFEDYLYKIIS